MIKEEQEQLLSGEKKAAVEGEKKGEKLIQEEGVETGRVSARVYLLYLGAIGFAISAAFVFLYFLSSGFSVGANIWLADWYAGFLKRTRGGIEEIECPPCMYELYVQQVSQPDPSCRALFSSQDAVVIEGCAFGFPTLGSQEAYEQGRSQGGAPPKSRGSQKFIRGTPL